LNSCNASGAFFSIFAVQMRRAQSILRPDAISLDYSKVWL
jgi:hypothetical protein